MSRDTETGFGDGVLQYVRDGPYAAGDSLLRRSLAVFVWWKIWAAGFVGAGAGLLLGMVLSP